MSEVVRRFFGKADNVRIIIYIHVVKKTGAFRESNSGPLAPKARIIPLDQMPI